MLRSAESKMVRLFSGEIIFANSWARTRGAQLSPRAYAAAAENQHVGKIRRRSIYSAERHATDTTYHQPTGQPM